MIPDPILWRLELASSFAFWHGSGSRSDRIDYAPSFHLFLYLLAGESLADNLGLLVDQHVLDGLVIAGSLGRAAERALGDCASLGNQFMQTE